MKHRDRYKSQFDDLPVCGVQNASYDLDTVLGVLWRKCRNDAAFSNTPVTIGPNWAGETMMLGDLIAIAKHAYRVSIDPALFVYDRLQGNLDDAQLEVDASPSQESNAALNALQRTFDSKPLLSRSARAWFRRILAAQAQRIADENDGGNGGDAA